MSETQTVSRRALLGIGVGAVLGLTGVKAAVDAIGNTFEKFNQVLPDSILKPVKIDSVSQEIEAGWRSLYMVRGGGTIGDIARRFYPDFNNNQPFYSAKLCFANRQTPGKNNMICPGQVLYIPDPRIPTLGFAAGESAVLRGQKINGEYLPTVVETIDPKTNLMRVSFNGKPVFNGVPKVGEELTTDRLLSIVAFLEEESGVPVPSRVIFEIAG